MGIDVVVRSDFVSENMPLTFACDVLWRRVKTKRCDTRKKTRDSHAHGVQ